MLDSCLAYTVKYVAKTYDRPRTLHPPADSRSVVETVAILMSFKNVENEGNKEVCTLVMTDHVCLETAVREETSRHETSAADARAIQPS